mmetsp:Transcript_4571/g.9912  ORF Transcript_4571/g.9912 Transcript_4571/m.9912 type:complete len:270 (+) Transcript_4571:216-1025(+)
MHVYHRPPPRSASPPPYRRHHRHHLYDRHSHRPHDAIACSPRLCSHLLAAIYSHNCRQGRHTADHPNRHCRRRFQCCTHCHRHCHRRSHCLVAAIGRPHHSRHQLDADAILAVASPFLPPLLLRCRSSHPVAAAQAVPVRRLVRCADLSLEPETSAAEGRPAFRNSSRSAFSERRKKKATLRCSCVDAGATEAWCSRASKQPAAPAAGPYLKGPPAAPTTRIAEGGSPGASSVSLTTTVCVMKSNSSVSWCTSNPVAASVSGLCRSACA